MMLTIVQLEDYLKTLLKPELWKDYCPNGLQVEGNRSINTLITGVTACQDLLNKAIELNADAILVHHGYFWKGENPCLLGFKRQRITTLLANQIHLLAYHLPLDGHKIYGNNVQLANLLNIKITGGFVNDQGPTSLGLIGELPELMTSQAFKSHLHAHLKREPLHIPGKINSLKRIAWCTGAAQDFIEQASELKVDAYITGEISERTVHIARETGLHFYAAGHHATERYGVKALGEHLAEHFGIKHYFIDVDNPV